MNDEIILGIRDMWGVPTPFGLSASDRRRHLYVVGQTGSGKTTLLVNMVMQDIMAGRGVAFIDPHGDAALEILDFIPKHRTEDVVYFDPSDSEFPFGFNLFGRVPPERRHLVVSGIVTAFRGIWSDSWGPRLEYILSAAISAVLECENESLLGVLRMLTDETYRAWVVRQVKDPMVRLFWENEFARYDKRFLQEAIAPIQNKVGQLLMTPQLRNILGQVRSRIDARLIMDGRHIFIANLSKGKLGPDKANLLGALWVTQFQLAAMSRADVPESERVPFHLYVDEFQSFVSDSFASIFSEARKYGLYLTIAHQYLEQVLPKILAAVKGNVGSMIAFRVGAEDAETIAAAFGNTYAPRAFTSLDNGEVYAKVLVGGQSCEPFRGRMFELQGRRQFRRDKIIGRSRRRYASERGRIERKIEAWFGRQTRSSPGTANPRRAPKSRGKI